MELTPSSADSSTALVDRAGVGVFKDFDGRNPNGDVHRMHTHGLDGIEDEPIKIVDACLILDKLFVGCANNIHISHTVHQLGINTVDEIDIAVLAIPVQSMQCKLHPVIDRKFVQRRSQRARQHERDQ